MLSIGLACISIPVTAAYSDDADCKVVSDSAKAAVGRSSGYVDSVATNTSSATAGAKSCVDTILAGYNRVVPDFGGGFEGIMSKFASDLLTKEGCKMFNDAKNSALQELPSGIRGTAQTAANGASAAQIEAAAAEEARRAAVSQAQAATSKAAPEKSIWSRMANLF